CKFQALMLLPEKAPGAVAAALGSLERSLGRRDFKRIFGLVLTGNGVEFAATEMLEGTLHGNEPRCKAHYCDVRASEQKGACEKNHVELRKILPKRRGISFDDLSPRDLAAAYRSHSLTQPDSWNDAPGLRSNLSRFPSVGGSAPVSRLHAFA
ncbi:MAG: IS30 family transposase, partial [Eggerthellaceae bacterium]|nr:IS30 family transposase [Eggerthellaceae bacterium]